MYSDAPYMQRALQLAEKAVGFVSPNPLVGAVIARNGVIIGEGYHKRCGGDHAEVEAIRDAEAHGHSVEGATLYVTLEPCSHFGKTPPCTDLIIAKKIRMVVVAMRDPHPEAGGGIEKLYAAGIHVRQGLMHKAAEEINRFYLHGLKFARPFFTAKAAISKNGMIAAAPNERTQISGTEAQVFTHALRQSHDALLVGAQTAVVDDPLLNVHYGDYRRDPLRVIIDAHLRVPADARVFRDENYLVFTCEERLPEHLKKECVHYVPSHDLISPHAIAASLWKRNIRSVLIEGGAMTIQTFVGAGIVDELILIRSPMQLPKAGVPLFPHQFPHGYIEKPDEALELGEDRVTVYAHAL